MNKDQVEARIEWIMDYLESVDEERCKLMSDLRKLDEDISNIYKAMRNLSKMVDE